MVTPYYYPFVIGGVERAVETFSKGLIKVGVDVDVLTINFVQNRTCCSWRLNVEKTDELRVFKAPALNPLPWQLHIDFITCKVNVIPLKFKDVMMKHDIIHFHNDSDLSFPFFSTHVKKPKIFHLHCLNLTFSFFKKHPLARKILERSASTFIVVSKLSKKLLEKLGIPEEAIKIIPNSIDLEHFVPSKNERINNLLLFVGRIDPAKDLITLFKALFCLKFPVHLIIAGPPTDRAYYERLRSIAKQINDRHFHKIDFVGALEPSYVVKLYQKAAIFVMPSRSESFPMSILEAMACETPVISTNVGSIPEIVHPYTNGILVPCGDHTKLAKGIQYLLENDSVRQEYGRNGRMLVSEYSVEKVARLLFQLYKEILSSE